MVKISPSILSSDYGNLESELKKMEECGADMIHVDVMDGHFVPNITLGAPIVKCIRKATKLTFDVHLMISDPYKYVPDFAKAGSDIITFHTESDSDTEKTIDEILSLGKKAGLSVKPGTPIEEIYPYLDKLSLVLIMTVEPGSSVSHDLGERAYLDFNVYVRWFDDYIERNGLHEEFARELALFHIKNTQARLHWKKVKDVNKEMNRLMIGLGDYPEFWKLLSRREKKIVTTYRLSSLLGYWRLYYYNWKNKL